MGKAVAVLFVFDNDNADDVRADELLLLLGRTFLERRLEATFRLTGTYAAAVTRRQRPELVEVLKRQDVGLYAVPANPESLRELTERHWNDGVRAFAHRETGGYQAVAFLAGRIPSCFGDSAWVPQAFGVLADWGTRVVLCRDSYLSDHGLPYFYGGRLNVCALGPNWIEIEDAVGSAGGMESLSDAVAERASVLRESGGVVCLHLSSGGLLKEPLRRGIEKGELGRILDAIAGVPEVTIQSARQIADRLADISYEHPIPMDFLQEMARSAATGQLRPYEYSAGFLSPSEQLYLITAAWDASHKKGKPVRNSTSRTPLGPAERARTDPAVKGIHADELERLIHELLQRLNRAGQLPSAVQVRQGKLAIADLLATLASGFHAGDLTPIDLPVCRAELAGEDRVRPELARQCWRGAGLPEDFDSPRQLELARLQLWTYKPVQL